MTAAKRERLIIRRPKTVNERTIARLAAHPKIRAQFSAALRRPIFPKDVYISGPAGRYVHFTLASSKKFHKESFRTKNVGDKGTRIIVGCPLGQWNGISCRVGMKLQAVLVPKERVKEVVKRTTRTTRFRSNPLLMTVTNPGYKKNPVDVDYDAKSKEYKVYRTNPGRKHSSNPVPLWDNPNFNGLKMEDNPGKHGVGWHKIDTKYVTKEDAKYAAFQLKAKTGHDFQSHGKGVIFYGPGAFIPKFRRLAEEMRKHGFRTNPFDLATASMPLYDDNPHYCDNPGYCDNPIHGNPLNTGEREEIAGIAQEDLEKGRTFPSGSVDRGFFTGRAVRGAQIADKYNDNPFQENLTAGEMAGYQNNLTPGEMAGFQNNPMDLAFPGYYAAAFNNNPGLKVGDFVRNLKRVMKGDELELDSRQLGRIVSQAQFMGDTVYTVQFFMPDGAQKTFKFFDRELKPEQTQLGMEENPIRRRRGRRTFRHNRYQPSQPKALQKYQRSSQGRLPKYGELNTLSKQPSSRAGGGSIHKSVKKVRIPVKQFEAWLSRSGNPDEKRRYAKAKAAYRRFHKGADPEFVTRRVVDVGAGKRVLGRSFAYSMGKSPFEPYITPKGSGKGSNKAYLHEYETLPDGLTVPGGKVVIKPLDGATKITDWIHR